MSTKPAAAQAGLAASRQSCRVWIASFSREEALRLTEDAGNASELLRPAPDGTLRAWPVSPRVNSPRNNDASLTEPTIMAAEGGGPNPA